MSVVEYQKGEKPERLKLQSSHQVKGTDIWVIFSYQLVEIGDHALKIHKVLQGWQTKIGPWEMAATKTMFSAEFARYQRTKMQGGKLRK